MKYKKTLLYSAILLSATMSFGAGYQIVEQGAANMGTAMAGATANANNDASCAFWNPSASTFIDFKDNQSTMVSATISGVFPTLCFTNENSTPYGSKTSDNCGVDSVVPNFFLVHKFSEEIYGTLSITAPYGLESDYDDNWIGRFQGLRSYLLTLDMNPSLIYKVNDWFSVSGGLSAQYAYCSLSQYVGRHMRISGDSWSVGGNIGFTVKYAEDGRFGFHWRSAIRHTLEGTVAGTSQHIKADMASPDTFTIGLYQRLRGTFDRFAVMAEYAYTRWSMFDELYVEGLGTPAIREDWQDASRVALGLHYFPTFDEDLVLRLGVAYDESPVRSPEEKTPRIPCCDRIWVSGGLGYTWDNITLDLAYTYIFLVGEKDINRTESSPIPTTVVGSYSGHIHVLSAQISYKF